MAGIVPLYQFGKRIIKVDLKKFNLSPKNLDRPVLTGYHKDYLPRIPLTPSLWIGWYPVRPDTP